MNRRSLFATLAATALATALPLGAAHAGGDALGVVTAYLAAWNAHDSTAAAGYFAETVSYYDASVGTPVVGREAAKTGVIDNFLNAVPDAVWTITGTPIVQDGRVAFEWEFKGTNSGAWVDGTAATGKSFSLTGASVFVIDGGLISNQSDYYDALGFYKQLGLM